jgi:hypothetical protein
MDVSINISRRWRLRFAINVRINARTQLVVISTQSDRSVDGKVFLCEVFPRSASIVLMKRGEGGFA